jgi:brefeldin A-resistance guanine nucleotide exchange factor 1
VKSINIILHLTSRIPDLIQQSHLERNEAWAAYWSPIFRALSAQCLNPCREIRHKAIATLQRSLLSGQLASEEHTEWIAIFGEVLFPLVLRLLKPEVYKLDQVGMGETRIQASNLLCKIFLRYLDELAKCGQMLDVWLRILDVLDRMMNSGQGDALEEAVPESLKNIILVMGGAGYLSRPSENPENEKMWIETKKKLDRFLPDLFSEVFPETRSKGKLEKEKEKDPAIGQMDSSSARRTSVEQT